MHRMYVRIDGQVHEGESWADGLMGGVSEDRMEVLSEEVFEDVMKPNLYPFAQDLIDQSKRAGQKVVLISGALDCVLLLGRL